MTLPITINDLLVKSDRADIDLEFFNSRSRAVMSALTSLDGRQAIYDAQSATLVELGLQRLNDAMGPMLETLTEAAGLGFLVCKSGGISRQLTLGSAVGWVITDGASIFTPTPFLLAQDDTDNTNWGILSIDPGGWVQESATLATHVVYASKTQASSSWTISANSAFVPAMQSMLSDSQTARDQAVSANASVAAQMATLAAAIAAIQSGPVSSVAGKTGAVMLVEGDIANLTADLAAKATTTALNTAVASKQDTTAKLTAISAMTWATNQILMATSAGTISTTTASALGLTLLNVANAAAAFTALNISAFMQTLLDDADASTALTTLGVSAFIKTLLDDADATAARATLGVVATAKATATELTTGTDDTKFATALGLAGQISLVNNIASTSYTLQASDNKKFVVFRNGSNSNCTFPNNLPIGFSCTVIQAAGAGAIHFLAATNAGRNSPYGSRDTELDAGGPDTDCCQVRCCVIDNSDGVHAQWYFTGDLD